MTEHERMIEARHAEILQQLANNRAVIDAVFLELQSLGDTLVCLTKMAERLIERSTTLWGNLER